LESFLLLSCDPSSTSFFAENIDLLIYDFILEMCKNLTLLFYISFFYTLYHKYFLKELILFSNDTWTFIYFITPYSTLEEFLS
jgi:hypothetical protein